MPYGSYHEAQGYPGVVWELCIPKSKLWGGGQTGHWARFQCITLQCFGFNFKTLFIYLKISKTKFRDSSWPKRSKQRANLFGRVWKKKFAQKWQACLIWAINYIISQISIFLNETNVIWFFQLITYCLGFIAWSMLNCLIFGKNSYKMDKIGHILVFDLCFTFFSWNFQYQW